MTYRYNVNIRSCVCMYICVYVCMYVFMYAFIYMYVCVCVSVCTYITTDVCIIYSVIHSQHHIFAYFPLCANKLHLLYTVYRISPPNMKCYNYML